MSRDNRKNRRAWSVYIVDIITYATHKISTLVICSGNVILLLQNEVGGLKLMQKTYLTYLTPL